MFAWILAAAIAASPVTVAVEAADTPALLRRGLQGHPPLMPWQGMWFKLSDEEVARFWMKDVTYPIDILFIDKNGNIDSIADSVPPCIEDSCPTYRSRGAVTHVLEVPAGWSKKHAVHPGAKVRAEGAIVVVTPQEGR